MFKTYSTYLANVPKLKIFIFLLHMQFFSGVLVPFFVTWGGVSLTQVLFIQAFFTFCMFACEVPTGAFADHYGRKKSLALGAFLCAVACVVYASYPSIYIFLLGELLFGVGITFVSGADEAILYDSLATEKKAHNYKKIFGNYHTFYLLALMLSAPLGSIIASMFGLRAPMFFTAVPFLFASAAALTMREPPIKKKHVHKKYWDTLVNGVKFFKDHRILRTLAFDMIAVSTLCFSVIWFCQPVLMEIGVPIALFGLVFAGMTAAGIPIMNNFEKLEKLAGSKLRYLQISAIIAGIAFIALGFTKIFLVVVLCVLAIEAFGLTRATLYSNYLNKHIDSHHRATVISTISMLGSLAMTVSYLLIGLMLKWSLRYTIIAVGALVLATVFVSGVREKHLLD